MAEKKIKSRIQHKHDLEVNWNQATNFIPLKGELIIYDIEVDENGATLTLPEGRETPYTYERFKIGDGIHVVSEVPFTITSELSNIKLPNADWRQNDETAPDYVKNRTHYEDAIIAAESYNSKTLLGMAEDAGRAIAWLDNYFVEVLYSDGSKYISTSFSAAACTLTNQADGTTIVARGTLDRRAHKWDLAVSTEETPVYMAYKQTIAVKQLDEKFIPVVSEDEFLAWLNEAKVVEPVAATSGELYTTNNNEMYIL